MAWHWKCKLWIWTKESLLLCAMLQCGVVKWWRIIRASRYKSSTATSPCCYPTVFMKLNKWNQQGLSSGAFWWYVSYWAYLALSMWAIGAVTRYVCNDHSLASFFDLHCLFFYQCNYIITIFSFYCFGGYQRFLSQFNLWP